MTVDRQPVGPRGSVVGFATINSFVFELFGAIDIMYKLTKALGYFSFLVAGGFALLGFVQLLRRKSLYKVDYRLLLLACFYVLMLVFYVFFEKFVVNYRPMILDEAEGLEASYPSSHTMMLLCIMGTARYLLPRLFRNRAFVSNGRAICAASMILMVGGRLLSGVHWFTDIVGACLLSAALVRLYIACVCCVGRRLRLKKRVQRTAR